mmetsp:Transcript_21068/g.32166  ORF Transcript_21068/g.32166 Transcript_21068/m.32166 type:complete len:332 (+) Transcript_21068:373-1368(+)
MPSRPMTSLGGGLLFDPSAVKLKASPKPTRKADVSSAPNSPILDMRKNLRPTTTIGMEPIKNEPSTPKFTTDGQVMRAPAAKPSSPSPLTKPKPLIPPGSSPPPVKPEKASPLPPSLSGKAAPPKKPVNDTKFKAQLANIPMVFPGSSPTLPIKEQNSENDENEESVMTKAESQPSLIFSPRSGTPTPAIDPKRKRRANKKLTAFLLRRPQREDLVKEGILRREAEAFPELGTEFHEKNEIPTKRPPALRIGKTCMERSNTCGKKVKGKRIHCYRCGNVTCKTHMHKDKQLMPEFNYEVPMPICVLCFHERRTEVIKHKAEYLKNIAKNIS